MQYLDPVTLDAEAIFGKAVELHLMACCGIDDTDSCECIRPARVQAEDVPMPAYWLMLWRGRAGLQNATNHTVRVTDELCEVHLPEHTLWHVLPGLLYFVG